MLVESVEHNDDYTEWTFTIREGITFHDGTPLDGAAVKFNIEACHRRPLTGAPLRVDQGRHRVGPGRHHHDQERPVGRAARLLRYGAVRLHVLAGVAGQPARRAPARPRAARSTTPSSPARRPTATRPPRSGSAPSCSSRTRRATATSSGPCATRTTGGARTASPVRTCRTSTRSRPSWPSTSTAAPTPLRSGQFDVMHTANADTISQFLDDDSVETIATSPLRRHQLHHAQRRRGTTPTPTDRPRGRQRRSPLLNVHCRRALAHAIDLERLAEERGAGSSTPANGPFPPGSIGYLEDTGYPPTTSTLAQAEMDTCLAELGTDSIEFDFNTTNDPFNVETNTLIISMWQEAFGDQVKATITPDRAGPVHRPRPAGQLRRVRLAQPRRDSIRTSSGCGGSARVGPDRRAGAQLRALLGRRDRREPDHHPDQPRRGGPHRGGRGHQPALRRAGLQPVAGLDHLGHHRRSRTSTRARTPCPTGPRASASPSPAATRSTRSGATKGSASSRCEGRALWDAVRRKPGLTTTAGAVVVLVGGWLRRPAHAVAFLGAFALDRRGRQRRQRHATSCGGC